MGVKIQYRTKSGADFDVTPSLVPAIDDLTTKVAAVVAARRAEGKFIGNLSVPISSRGGGHFDTNIAMAASITSRVETEFGADLWLLNPAAYDLPRPATGSDYMAVWSDILAGADGQGKDFDMVYFVGPHDVWSFFGAQPPDRLGAITRWLKAQASADLKYQEILSNKEKLRSFVRYYGLRGSAAFSKGAHDEWNIVSSLNALRAVGDSIAIYFDGRPVEPGDYDDLTRHGVPVTVLHGV